MTPDPPAGLDTRLGYWLREVSNLLHERFAETLAAHDVSPPLWAILITVQRGEAGTPAALARRLDTDPAVMTRRLDQLEARGLILRRRKPEDRRSVEIALTAEGAALVPQLAAISSELTDAALGGVSHGERTRLLRALRRMHQNLKAADEAHSEAQLARASA